MATPSSWWREEGLFEEIASRLDEVRAIDVHTHLLMPGSFHPEFDEGMPLRLRSTNPDYAVALTERFGVEVKPGGMEVAAREAEKVRAQLISRLGWTGIGTTTSISPGQRLPW